MTQNMNPQLIAALMGLTRLNEGEGLLLALHPDFILAVRPSMNEDEREATADALLSTAGSPFLLPAMENPTEDEDGKRSNQHIPSGTLDMVLTAR